MIRFLILGIIILSVYLGLSYLPVINDSILIFFRNYQIEFSVSVAILSLLLIQFVTLIFTKLVYSIFCFPYIIKNYFRNKSLKKIEMTIALIIESYLLGLKDKSLNMTKEIYSKLNDTQQKIANIIIAETTDSIEEKVIYYQKLLDNKTYAPYAHKKLASILLQNNNYNLAEKHAIKYFDFDENDKENIFTLMNIYFAAGERQKLLLLVSKIENIEDQFWQDNADQVATYLYKVAQDLVNIGEEEEAKKYLEYSFKIKPDHIETISLYSEIAINSNASSQVLAIAKAAFNYAPSFDIAKIYADNANHRAPEEIYNDLASAASPNKYKGIFLAIAAYLDLNDKIQQLK
ncbi:MAG: heme biosynthesis protein HemY [Rickettsiaceae bacterium]|nr:heme biosynthesis protein HemY [Rickettsiaceae bacterium]